jgi:putative transposase
MRDTWTEPDVRDQVIDFVRLWSAKTEIMTSRFIAWLGVPKSKFYSWRDRYGQVNEHNSWLPRDYWLSDWEKKAIIDYFSAHREDGYRRVCYMMLDDDIVAVSPSSVYRVLNKAGMLRKWNPKERSKGQGFSPPEKAHDHWHIDLSYLNICGTFYYLCSILDGYSRSIVHWEIRGSMTEADVEIVLQRAKEMYPDKKPRIISDNGPQFMAKDFKEFIRLAGMTHVRTSPYYPQSNGKIERWHQSLKKECIRPQTPLDLGDAKRLVTNFVDYYNTKRLHSALGYITPQDKLAGKENQIFAERDRKLEIARQARKQKRLNDKLMTQANAVLAISYR